MMGRKNRFEFRKKENGAVGSEVDEERGAQKSQRLTVTQRDQLPFVSKIFAHFCPSKNFQTSCPSVFCVALEKAQSSLKKYTLVIFAL